MTALAATANVHAAAQEWRLDPVHTRVLIAISHDGYSDALGTVSGSTGWLRYDPDAPAQTQLLACVPLDRLDFGDADWNRAVARLLGTAAHPLARFVAIGATPVAATTADAPDAAPRVSVSGSLTLNGSTRPMTLTITVNRIGRLPLPPFRQRLGASARTELQRADFGVDAWPSLIGATVQVRIEAEAEAARAPFPATATLATLEALPCP